MVSLQVLVDFIPVQMAMGSIHLPLMVLTGVTMDPLLEGPVDLALLLPVHLAPLVLAFLNLRILYLHKAHHQTVALVAPDQMVVVPPGPLAPMVLLQEEWVLLLEKVIQVAPHLLAPLHLGVIWGMDDVHQIWGDLPLLREMVPATIEEALLRAVVSS